MNINVQELNLTELRRQKRPLWMSDLGIDNFADIIGGGGDVYLDRLPIDSPRHEGRELTEEEEEQLGPVAFEAERSEVAAEM